MMIQQFFSNGLSLMSGLASTAPKQPLMFQASVMDVGQRGKRYGMAQCTRDISWTDCGKCLDAQLVTFRAIIGNKRGWEIYGSNCFMWYHDFQFYSNISTTASEFCGYVSYSFLFFLIRKLILFVPIITSILLMFWWNKWNWCISLQVQEDRLHMELELA